MLLAGSVLDRIPGPKYTAKLRFAELSLRGPLPRPATLRRLRSDLPEDFVLALRAPKSALVAARGPLRFDAELERGFDWLLAARTALAAKITLLPTPADLTPGQRDRDLLAALAARLPRDAGLIWAWEPSGPWQADEAAQLAAALELVLVFDPLLAPRPTGRVAYARLRALGARKSFSDAALAQIAEQLAREPDAESFVAIDAERSFVPAQRLQRIALGGDGDPVA